MKKIFYLVFLIVLGVAAFFVFRPKPEVVEVYSVQRRDFVEALSRDGILQSRNKVTLFAPGAGNLNIQQIKVKVGDFVKKGQVVTMVESDILFSVKSSMDGVVSKVFRSSSGPVTRGEALIEVSDVSDLEVVVEALTQEAVKLELNMDAKILNWGGEGELSARVSQISRAASVKVSSLGVDEERTEVKLKLENIPENLKAKLGDNFHVDVQFLLSKVPNGLVLPLGALLKKEDRWAVYKIENLKAVYREVQVLKKNDREALVGEGLLEGDQIVLFPNDKISDGTAVTVKGL